MKSKITVTVGIPAYNEAANIGFLIQDLLDQNCNNIELVKIIVASDGSTDSTADIVRSFNNPKVEIIDNKDRLGQAARQNQIMELTDTDVLVLLNADIKLETKDLLDIFANEITQGNDLVCGPLTELAPKGFIEKVIAVGASYRRKVFENYNEGSNILTCHGSHRAFSKKLYKSFRFSGSIAEDANSYLYCVSNGYKYKYAKGAVVSIKLPENISDHIKQSVRFFNSPMTLNETYDKELLKTQSKWPVRTFVKYGIEFLIKNPVYFTIYSLICIYILVGTKLNLLKSSNTWKISTSSKVLRSANK